MKNVMSVVDVPALLVARFVIINGTKVRADGLPGKDKKAGDTARLFFAGFYRFFMQKIESQFFA